MFSLVTLPALLAFLEQARIVFSTCPVGTPSPVSITGTSITANAYNGCGTIISLAIASTVTAIGNYTILTKNI